MRPLLLALFASGCLFLCATPLFAGMCSPSFFSPDRSLVVNDNDIVIRQAGGAQFAKSPVAAEVYAGDEVGLIAKDGDLANVETVNGERGWIEAKHLISWESFLASEKAKGDQGMYQGCEGLDVPTTFSLDVDGDGAMETLTLSCLPGYECAFFTTRVTDAKGGVVYQGPNWGDSPLIFCQCGEGSYYPELVGDINGDKKAEVLATALGSDLSASSHWVGAFDGKEFKTIQEEKALIEDPAKPGFFAFVDPPGNEYESGVRWIMSFSGWNADGKAIGTVFQIRKNPQTGDSTDVYSGEGLFTPESGGFKLAGWEKPFELTQ